MRKNNLFGNLTPLGLVLLAACKGTTTSTFIADFTGTVEDEPLLNAIAFLDITIMEHWMLGNRSSVRFRTVVILWSWVLIDRGAGLSSCKITTF